MIQLIFHNFEFGAETTSVLVSMENFIVNHINNDIVAVYLTLEEIRSLYDDDALDRALDHQLKFTFRGVRVHQCLYRTTFGDKAILVIPKTDFNDTYQIEVLSGMELVTDLAANSTLESMAAIETRLQTFEFPALPDGQPALRPLPLPAMATMDDNNSEEKDDAVGDEEEEEEEEEEHSDEYGLYSDKFENPRPAPSVPCQH